MAAFAQLKSVDDPRDRLDRAHRIELIRFAQQNGVTEVDPEMPAILMRQILRRRGLTNIDIPPRLLGQTQRGGAVVANTQERTVATDAAADLAKQWENQKKAKVETKAPETINELRAAVKAKGIRLSRRDTMETLKAKLNG